MSFYDDASIVLIPSGYKTSKLYSQKPTDGSGDLTFSRTGSTATRVNESGLIEECRTNLSLQSEDFNTTWLKFNSPVSTNTTLSPIGTMTADSLFDNATNDSHSLRQSFTFLSSVYVVSVYAKADTLSNIQLMIYDGTSFLKSGRFDLLNGTVQFTSNMKIENVGNGWYRCSFFTTTTTGSGFFYVLTNNGSTDIYSGTGKSVFIWGYQAEIGDIATDYIPTTAAAVTVGPVANMPRLDYTGGGCPKLLMEPTRTNLLTFSEQFNNAAWTKVNTTVTANNAISPDGYQNADFIVPANLTDGFISFPGNSFISGTTYTLSIFAKKEDFNFLILVFPITAFPANNRSALFDLNNGTIASATQTGTGAVITNYNNGWYRCSISITAITTTSGTIVYGARSSNNLTSLGNGTDGIFIYGAQLEVGSYATSYIPTLNATVTRNADVLSKTSITSLIGQTEGTLFVEVDAIRTGINQNFELSDGTITNRLDLRLTNINNFQLVIVQSGSIIFNQTSVGTFAQGQKIKIAAAYKSNDVTQLYVNGVSVASATAGTIIGNLTAFYNASIGGTVDAFNSPTNQILVFKTRLSNAELATLTTL